MQMTPPLWQKVKTLEPLDETGRGELRTGLKLSIQKAKIMTSDLNTSWQIDGETVETARFFRAPKSLQMVTAAVKLKNACSLKEKL